MSGPEHKEMSFLEHLEELRWHLVRSALAITIFAIAAFVFKKIIFDEIVFAPGNKDFFTNRMLKHIGESIGMNLAINQGEIHIISRKMAGQFYAHLIVSMISGLIVAFPYVLYEIWSFISPALYPKEKKYTRQIFFYSSFLFFTGVIFGYFVISPLTVHFFGYYSTSARVTNEPDIMSYISTVASVVLASGIIFELPLLVYFLAKMGVITPGFLRKYRKHAFILTLLVSAIITPPDIFSQLLVSLPLVVLYEVGIKIAKKVTVQETIKNNESKTS